MFTEDDFQAALDLHPDDHSARAVFADWLDEQNDPRAEGYRALARCRLCPEATRANRWSLYRAESYQATFPPPDTAISWPFLPGDWFALIPNPAPNSSPPSMLWSNSRRELDDAAALVFAQLPDARRAELSAAPALTPAPQG